MRLLLLCLFLLSSSVSKIDAQQEQRYVFFLHNMYLETAGVDDPHPEYGKCEYREILEAFRKEGFTVISEIRPKGTDGMEYAKKVQTQIDSLLVKGVKAHQVTVVGTSKGAYIAWHVAALMKRRHMNFVLLGICNESTLEENKNIQPCGNILSIYERSDVLGHSCASLQKTSPCISQFKEIELNTGMKHGFLYKALPAWIEPTVKWARGNYEFK